MKMIKEGKTEHVTIPEHTIRHKKSLKPQGQDEHKTKESRGRSWIILGCSLLTILVLLAAALLMFSGSGENIHRNVSQDVDSDVDGLTDTDEAQRGTNPFVADTDSDGYIDGEEVKNGFNPLLTPEEEG